jgi:MscS family membrane protein
MMNSLAGLLPDFRTPLRVRSLVRASQRLAVNMCAAVLLFVPVTAAHAQSGIFKPNVANAAQDSVAPAATVVSPDSPRASVMAFLQLAGQHNYAQASQYLDLPPDQSARGTELARRLSEVLDQRLWIEVERVSPFAEGNVDDDDPLRDRLGVIPGATGLPEPVLVARFDGGSVRRWRFDRATVAQIDAWYDALPDAWLRGKVPAPLLRVGPFGVHYWQWIGMVIAVFATIALAGILALGARWVLSLLTKRTTTEWDDLVVARLRGPFRLWLVGILAMPLFGLLGLNVRVGGFVSATSRGLVLVSFFWCALRIIGLVQDQLLAGSWANGAPQARTLVPLLTRFLRVSVTIVALLVVLSQFGYPVGTLLAGVGIGGVALALASQKTVEHLFGSISLAADKVFRVGDFVRVGDVEGTVERIGLRSTSLRTLARTVVRIPNGRLAEERIETFGERDRFLLQHDLGVTYDTTPDQIRGIAVAIEARLREEPTLWPDTVIVRTIGFADSAITIRVRAWLDVPDFNTFLDVQHVLLLSFMDIIQDAGSTFAFPSRTVYHMYPDGERAVSLPPESVS